MTDTIISANTTGTYIGDYTTVTDLELTESAPTTNQSGQSEYYVSSYNTSDRRHTLLRFDDLTMITSPVTVSAATVYQYHIDSVNSGSTNVIRFRRLLVSFVEAEATWNIRATSTNWTTAGCLSDGNDRSSTTTVDFSPGITTGSFKSCTSSQMNTDVENIINGSASNLGWLQSRPTEATTDFYYDQFRGTGGNDGERPAIVVTYTASTGNPWYYYAQQ